MTKWDELVAEAAGAADCTFRKAEAALRALLAKGIKFVPGEATGFMRRAAVEAEIGEGGPCIRSMINAAISAGSIKPEGE